MLNMRSGRTVIAIFCVKIIFNLYIVFILIYYNMRKITLLRLFCVLTALGSSAAHLFSQGTESFTHSSTSSSYATISWTGNNGLSWTSADSRGDQVITTGNKAICIRQTAGKLTGPLTASQQTAGVGVITFTAKNTAASSDNTKTTTYQFVCGSVTKTITVPAMGTSAVTVTSPEINSYDATKIEISITGSSGVRVTIDDLSWTAAASTTGTSAPSFSPTGGTYTSAQSISLTSETSNAKIYYSINGSTDPDKTTGTLYTAGSPIALTTSGTYVIKAIAYDSNDANPGSVVSSTYVINLAPSIVSSVSTVPSMYATVGGTDTEKITVSGTNLTNNIALALSGTDKDLFSLSATEVVSTAGTAAQTEITITYTPVAAGTHTASLTLSSGSASPVVLALSATAVWPSVSTPVAAAATSVGATGFTANWAKATNATSYDVSVYTKSGTKITEAFDGGTTSPTDWTFTGMGSYTSSSTGYFGASAPSLKFDTSADQVVTPLYADAVNGISFWLRGSGTDATSALLVEGSANGTDWSTIENIVPLPTAGTLKLYNAASTPALASGYKQFRFTYTKSVGNVAFDDFTYMVNYTETAVSGSPFNTTDLSVAVTGLTENVSYYYTVVGKSDHAVSSASNEISVTTGAVTSANTPSLISNVRVLNGKIVLNAKAGAVVELYSAMGQKLASVIASEGVNTLSVGAKGLVVVKQGNTVAKVIL